MTDAFPKGRYYLVDQLNRASLSIAANLAEGNGRWHKADRRRFFLIARGSTHECIPLLEVCRRKGFLDENIHRDVKEELDTIGKMISGLLKTSTKTS